MHCFNFVLAETVVHTLLSLQERLEHICWSCARRSLTQGEPIELQKVLCICVHLLEVELLVN